MNIILNVVANKDACVVTKAVNGVVTVLDRVTNTGDLTTNELVLKHLFLNLNKVKNDLSHEDLLVLCVQNFHLANWLNGFMPNDTNIKYYGDCVLLLDSIDCNYRAIELTKSAVKALLNKKANTKIVGMGINDVFRL